MDLVIKMPKIKLKLVNKNTCKYHNQIVTQIKMTTVFTPAITETSTIDIPLALESKISSLITDTITRNKKILSAKQRVNISIRDYIHCLDAYKLVKEGDVCKGVVFHHNGGGAGCYAFVKLKYLCFEPKVFMISFMYQSPEIVYEAEEFVEYIRTEYDRLGNEKPTSTDLTEPEINANE